MLYISFLHKIRESQVKHTRRRVVGLSASTTTTRPVEGAVANVGRGKATERVRGVAIRLPAWVSGKRSHLVPVAFTD